MTNPNDPWAQRPEDAPTEHIGPPGKPGFGQSSQTTEYTEAYGQGGATSVYPSTEQFDPWAPPPANATKEFPPYASQPQWGAYGEPWAGGQDPTQVGGYAQSSAQYPPGPPGAPLPPDQQPPRKRNTALWIALGLGVVLLIGAVAVVAGVVLGGKDSSSSTAASTSALPTAGRPTGTPPSGRPTPTQVIPSIPGLGGIDNLGATMGTISANSGGQLTLDTLGGSKVTVRTTDKTQVISLKGGKAADLPVGDMVMVQGDKAADGSIDAKIIISTALPGGTR
ncbi:DUF5666 domain-containing protein [Nocardia sp. CA-129566]|uniref:DUF5666 domain-containing protein n=1 Tax=Nocardia sp. CA-129566 TaxID=3239976 RepID=UPI003D9784E7